MKNKIAVLLQATACLSFLLTQAKADSLPAATEAPDYKAFPLGIFDINSTEDLEAAGKLNCNFVETKSAYVTEAYAKKAGSLGLAVVPFLLDGKMAAEDIPGHFKALNLERFRDANAFPAIFAVDEPSGGRVPAADVIAAYHELGKILSQPQVTVLNRVLETPQYFDGYDILSLDPYPVVYGGTVGGRLSTVSQEVDLAKRVNGGKPIWIALQAFGNYGGWQRPPRGDELTAMAGLAVTHGARGLWYYTWNAQNVKEIQMIKQLPELQDAIREIARKIAIASPLLGDPLNDESLVHGPVHVRIVTKADQCAVMVAHSGYEARSASISSPLFRDAHLIGNNKALSLHGDTLSVEFPSCGFEVAQLKLAGKSPGSVKASIAIKPEAPEDVVLNDCASIAASSNSPGEPGGPYRELKMGDGSLNNNWASAQHYKLPITIRVTFEQPRTVSQVVIHPMIMSGAVGYDAWGETEIVTSDGQSVDKTFTGADGGPYTFDLKPGKLEWFEVVIKTTLSKTNYVGCREIEIH